MTTLREAFSGLPVRLIQPTFPDPAEPCWVCLTDHRWFGLSVLPAEATDEDLRGGLGCGSPLDFAYFSVAVSERGIANTKTPNGYLLEPLIYQLLVVGSTNYAYACWYTQQQREAVVSFLESIIEDCSGDVVCGGYVDSLFETLRLWSRAAAASPRPRKEWHRNDKTPPSKSLPPDLVHQWCVFAERWALSFNDHSFVLPLNRALEQVRVEADLKTLSDLYRKLKQRRSTYWMGLGSYDDALDVQIQRVDDSILPNG